MNKDINSIIESMIFASGEPIAIGKIAKAAGIKKNEADKAIAELSEEYAKNQRGMILIKSDVKVQMATNPEYGAYIRKLVNNELEGALSQASYEVLSIIAYKGLVSRAEIEAIRGVNSSYVVRILLMRGLIDRLDNPEDKRAYKYQVSFDFLKTMGIKKISDLPDYQKLSKDKRIDNMVNNDVIEKINKDG